MGSTGSNGGYFCTLEREIKNVALFKLEMFENILKNLKIYYFLNILKEILRFFEKSFKILSKFSRRFRGKLEDLGHIYL